MRDEREDVVPSQVGTLLEHDSYHRKVLGEDESLLAEIAEAIGAEQLERSSNGDYDLRSAIRRLRKSQGILRTRLVNWQRSRAPRRVRVDLFGNTIVTLEANRAYLVATARRDAVTGEPELLIIHPRLGAGHLGRTRNQVYAPTLPIAVHELVELRLWKLVERKLIRGEDGCSVEIDCDPRSPLPGTIAEWNRRHPTRSQVLDGLFHYQAQKKETEAEGALSRIGSVERMMRWGAGWRLRYLMNAADEDLDLRAFAAEVDSLLPRSATSFGEALDSFQASEPGTVLKLQGRPTARDLTVLRDRMDQDGAFEVEVFQRKTTGDWFAVKGHEQRVFDASVVDRLGMAGDVRSSYHNHPSAGDPNESPPTPNDLVSILQQPSPKVAAVGGRSYVYVYSARNFARPGDLDEALLQELKGEWERIGYRVERALRKKRIERSGVSDAFYRDWKAHVEALGFELERFSWQDFETREDEIRERLEDDTPAVAAPEDVIAMNSHCSVTSRDSAGG